MAAGGVLARLRAAPAALAPVELPAEAFQNLVRSPALAAMQIETPKPLPAYSVVTDVVGPPPAPPEVIAAPEPAPSDETHAGPVRRAPIGKDAPNAVPWNPRWREPEPEPDSLEDQIVAAIGDPAQAAALLKQLDAEAARASFPEFVKQAWHVVEPSTKLDWNWHHQLICLVLQALFFDWMKAQRIEGYINRVRNAIFSVPPGSLKSRIIAVCFHAWTWLHWPGLKFICLSVNDDAVMRDARATRDLIKSPWYVESFAPSFKDKAGNTRRWVLKDDQDAVSDYANTAGGERKSMAAKSEIVGLRADIVLIDDPNNPKKAENKNDRDEVNTLWSTNQYNRVNDPQKSLRIGVQQRTHALDWTGNVIKLQGLWSDKCDHCNSTGKVEEAKCQKCDGKGHNRDGWLNIVLPAEFDPNRKFVLPAPLAEILREVLPPEELVLEDPRVEQGQTIHEGRFTKEYLDSERKRWNGTSNFENQMQQLPARVGGQKVDRAWLNWFRLAAGVRDTIDELDTGRPRPALCHDGDAQVVHAKHYSPGQWDFDWVTISLDPAAKKTTKGSNWGLLVIAGKGGRRYVLDDRTQRGALHEIIDIIVELIHLWQPDSILVEPKAAGPDVMDTLLERMGEGDVPMVSIWECDPGNDDKEMRLEAATPTIKNGMLALLDGAPWLEEFVKELSDFPAAENDDRVDALSQCLNFKRAADDAWPDM